jgi:large subunit ribosomal protein L10
MPKDEKVKFIEELKERIRSATALYFIDFTGLTANDFNDFRQHARQRRMTVKVVKNQLALRALMECGVPERIAEVLRGPTSMVFATEDPVAPARFLKEVTRRLVNLKFKGAFLEHAIYTPEQFDLLASLPTKEELRVELVGVLNGPIARLIWVLEGMLSELVWVLEELSKRGAGAEGAV